MEQPQICLDNEQSDFLQVLLAQIHQQGWHSEVWPYDHMAICATAQSRLVFLVATSLWGAGFRVNSSYVTMLA